MMSDKEEVNRDILEYLSKESNLSENDRLRYLRAIFEKHFAFEQLDHLLTYYDFHTIVSDAKVRYNDVKPEISERKLSPYEVPHVALIEAVIMYLNGKGILRKFVKVDYKNKGRR